MWPLLCWDTAGARTREEIYPLTRDTHWHRNLYNIWGGKRKVKDNISCETGEWRLNKKGLRQERSCSCWSRWRWWWWWWLSLCLWQTDKDDVGVYKDASQKPTCCCHTVTWLERPPVGKSLQCEAFPSVSNRVAWLAGGSIDWVGKQEGAVVSRAG